MDDLFDLFMDEFQTLDEAKPALYNNYPGIPTEELYISDENGVWIIYREGA